MKNSKTVNWLDLLTSIKNIKICGCWKESIFSIIKKCLTVKYYVNWNSHNFTATKLIFKNSFLIRHEILHLEIHIIDFHSSRTYLLSRPKKLRRLVLDILYSIGQKKDDAENDNNLDKKGQRLIIFWLFQKPWRNPKIPGSNLYNPHKYLKSRREAQKHVETTK